MSWKGQNPPANDVLAYLRVELPGEMTAYIEIDKLPSAGPGSIPVYRASIGTLFQYEDLGRSADLEGLLRHAHQVARAETVAAARKAVADMRAWAVLPL